jgi:ABC-type antimicrobial peptide transport system permease subunit
MTPSLAATALIACVAVGHAALRPLIARLTARNMLRRWGRMSTIILGVALAVSLVTASLGLGDSLDQSVRSALSADYGSMTATVSGHFSAQQARAAQNWLKAQPGVAATTALGRSPGALTITSERTGFSQQSVTAVGLPSGFTSTFGPVMTTRGDIHHIDTLRSGQVLISESLAHSLSVRAGDRLEVDFLGHTATADVAAVMTTDIAATTLDLQTGDLAEAVMPMADYAALLENGGATTTLALRTRRGDISAVLAGALRRHFGIRAVPARQKRSGYGSAGDGGPALTLASQIRAAAGRASFLGALGTQEYQQLGQLLPSLAILLLGCGIALLILMVVLLITERRAEIGMARAVGLPRSWLVNSVLLECLTCTAAALCVGIPAGVGLTALELAQLAHLPLQAPTGGSVHLPLHVHLAAASIGEVIALFALITTAVVLIAGFRAANSDCVSAIGGVPSFAPEVPFRAIIRRLARIRPAARPGLSRTARMSWWGAFAHLLLALGRGGLLPAAAGVCCLLGASAQQSLWAAAVPPQLRGAVPFAAYWLHQLGSGLCIVAAGLMAAWALRALGAPRQLAARAGLTLAGAACLLYALQPDGTIFGLFQTPGAAFLVSPDAGHLSGSVWTLVLGDILLVGGAVAIAIANLDVLAAIVARAGRMFRTTAPAVTVACAYLLANRFRALVTVTATALVVFLMGLILTVSGTVSAASRDSSNSGGFQLSAVAEASGDSRGAAPHRPGTPRQQDVASMVAGDALRAIVAATGRLQTARGAAVNNISLLVPGRPPQPVASRVASVSQSFADANLLPLSARATGFASDRSVWRALESRPGLAVWRSEPGIQGLNTQRSGFRPFTVQVATADGTHAVTVIGIAAATTRWPDLFVSTATFGKIIRPSADASTEWLFRLTPGTSIAHAAQALAARLHPAGLNIQPLVTTQAADAEQVTAVLLSGYLALGLPFGALALGVITSRSVLERQRQTGMLRAIGLRDGGVIAALLTEVGFIAALSLALGIGLALWSASRILTALVPAMSIPVSDFIGISAGGLALTALAVIVPCRRATSTPPAAAVRAL